MKQSVCLRLLTPIALLGPTIFLPANASSSEPPGNRDLIRVVAFHANARPAALDNVDHRVFVLDNRGHIYALDSRNGKLVSQTHLPGAGDLRTAVYDPATHHVIIAAVHRSFRKRGQTPLGLIRVYTCDARTLQVIRAVVVAQNGLQQLSQQPEDAVVDKRTGRVFVLLSFGTVVVVDGNTGAVKVRIAAGGPASQEELDTDSGLLFVNNFGQDITGATKSLTVINARALKVVRRLAVAPTPPPSSPVIPSRGESCRFLGLDPWSAQLFLIGLHWGQPATAVVSVDALYGLKVGSLPLSALGPGFVDRQLKRVYVATSTSAAPYTPDHLAFLSEDLTLLRTLQVGGRIAAIDTDIHGHRIFTVDSVNGVVHVFDSWSGKLLRSFYLSRPTHDQYGGLNPVSILISGPTHRAFVGEGNGRIAIFNSTLAG